LAPLAAVARVATLALPVGVFALVVRSSRQRLGFAAVTCALGAVAFGPAHVFESWLKVWAGLEEGIAASTQLVALIYAFLVVAPLEQGLKVAVVAPVWRSRYFDAPIDGVIYAAAGALGFVTAHNAFYLFAVIPNGFGAVLRAAVAVPAHLFFAGAWGYALARDPQKRLGGRVFNFVWVVAMVFNGIFDHMTFARSLTAVIGTIPILFCMALVTWIAARDLLQRSEVPQSRPSRVRRFLPAIAPPSIEAVRAALRRTERPVMLPWIGFGALVTTGVMTTALVSAVALGHRFGIDFAAVDRSESSASGAAPLVLLGAAALAAFPMAGYLVARASSARSVLEPAISAALAIAGTLVLLGLAAPVAVVFAIAFAPVALALACVGAWVGMPR
jgi:RsiW-degrading membrane proteinase PrsW (M82 family)